MDVAKIYPGGGGGLNSDDADFLIKETEYMNLSGMRWGSTDKGVTGVLESIGSTVLIENPNKPAGNNICIRGAVDRPNHQAILCYWNDQGNHSIFSFNYLSNTLQVVLLNSQVTGGLGFDKYHLVDGYVQNGCFYWTDNVNIPRRIHILSAINMNLGGGSPAYTSPLSQSVIAWIRRQPGLPPLQLKALDVPTPAVNFIDKSAFQFAYRYQYKTFEYGTLSGLSTTADFDEQDPPSTITSLNVANTSLVTRGYLATNMLLPSAPTPAYGPGVLAKITRQGTGGSSAPNTDIPITLDWTGYPGARSYTRVIVEGINSYFKALPGSDNPGNLTSGDRPETPGGDSGLSYKWYISYRDGVHPTLNILQTWDWGLSDSSFPPTTAANLSLFTETAGQSKQYNRIDVTIPFGETIDQDVAQIDLVARDLVTNFYGIIRSWKASNAADAAAITQHNLGITALSYSFYNNIAPIAIDPAYAIKPFDSVPVLAKTIERAKNRGFMGNYTIGYDTQQLITSLSCSFTTEQIGSAPGSPITGEWYNIRFLAGIRGIFSEYIIRTTTPLSPQPSAPTYLYTTEGAGPPFPANISAGIIFIGTTLSEVMTYYINKAGDTGSGTLLQFVDQSASSALQAENTTLGLGVRAKVHKQNAAKQVSISFIDGYGQKGGIVTNNALLVNIPNTGFTDNEYVTVINWMLSNTNAAVEIPPWATAYSINITKCLRTRFFVEAIGFPLYASKDASGNFVIDQHEYSTDWVGIGIDISFLSANGMGYVFTQGDIMNFTLVGGSTNYSSAVIGQQGKYVIIQLQDIGTLGSNSLVLYEIYTPYKPAAGVSEPHYEIGQIFPVANAGLPSRSYSITQGSIGGDVYLFQRTNFSIPYFAEAMSPNDKLYQYWLTDAGRINNVDYIGQVTKATSVCYSNTYISGSENNGLSTFDSGASEDLAPELGPIEKLILSSKVGKIGTVMLAICSAPAVASLYLGESTLLLENGSTTLGQSDKVIGSIHQLKNDFGTVSAESVVERNGNIYWWDVQSGKIIQYADDGLFAVSGYKLTRMAKLFSDQYKSMTPQQIEALGGRPFIIGGVDPHHEELLFSIPTTLAAPPKGYLPDYPGTIYPFDIWDGQAKTLMYRIAANPNKWNGSMPCNPEYIFDLEDNLFMVKNGDLYRCNDTSSYGNFFGVQTQPQVSSVFNKDLDDPKVWNNLSIEGNAAPVLAYLMTQVPWLQSSDLISSDFTNREGIWYATIYNNKLDPKYQMNFSKALISGEKMRSAALYINLSFDATQGIIQIKFVNAGYDLSAGHQLGQLR